MWMPVLWLKLFTIEGISNLKWQYKRPSESLSDGLSLIKSDYLQLTPEFEAYRRCRLWMHLVALLPDTVLTPFPLLEADRFFTPLPTAVAASFWTSASGKRYCLNWFWFLWRHMHWSWMTNLQLQIRGPRIFCCSLVYSPLMVTSVSQLQNKGDLPIIASFRRNLREDTWFYIHFIPECSSVRAIGRPIGFTVQ